MLKDPGVFPCRTFFLAGKTRLGVVVLLMQVSLIFWPLALDWARQYERDVNLERRLDELVRDYRLPANYLRHKGKTFAAAA